MSPKCLSKVIMVLFSLIANMNSQIKPRLGIKTCYILHIHPSGFHFVILRLNSDKETACLISFGMRDHECIIGPKFRIIP